MVTVPLWEGWQFRRFRGWFDGEGSLNPADMRRALVITDETARHPFLASLPPHVRAAQAPRMAHKAPWFTLRDLQDFLMAYCACFLAVSTFLI
jgi:hypothetical protein